MKRTGWWAGLLALALAGPGLIAPGIASAANITITDDDFNGVVITPDANFEGGVTPAPGVGSFEDRTLSGAWLANVGAVGSGIIYIVEPGTDILSDILDATWDSDNPGGFSLATIDLRFESDVNGALASGRTIPIDFLPFAVEETGLLQGMNGLFRDPVTAALVSLPSNLTIFASSDVAEPSTLALLGMGLVVSLAGYGRKRITN